LIFHGYLRCAPIFLSGFSLSAVALAKADLIGKLVSYVRVITLRRIGKPACRQAGWEIVLSGSLHLYGAISLGKEFKFE